MTVKNRVAIVTGGAKGNGRGIVNALAAGGAKIVIFDFFHRHEFALKFHDWIIDKFY